MSRTVVLADNVAHGADLRKTTNEKPAPQDERRGRVRVALAWKLLLFRAERSQPIESNTKNISSEGFYCLVAERFEPGERIRCTIALPTLSARHTADRMSLECQARVIRIESQQASHYGLACRIEDYSVVRDRAAR